MTGKECSAAGFWFSHHPALWYNTYCTGTSRGDQVLSYPTSRNRTPHLDGQRSRLQSALDELLIKVEEPAHVLEGIGRHVGRDVENVAGAKYSSR